MYAHTYIHYMPTKACLHNSPQRTRLRPGNGLKFLPQLDAAIPLIHMYTQRKNTLNARATPWHIRPPKLLQRRVNSLLHFLTLYCFLPHFLCLLELLRCFVGVVGVVDVVLADDRFVTALQCFASGLVAAPMCFFDVVVVAVAGDGDVVDLCCCGKHTCC